MEKYFQDKVKTQRLVTCMKAGVAEADTMTRESKVFSSDGRGGRNIYPDIRRSYVNAKVREMLESRYITNSSNNFDGELFEWDENLSFLIVHDDGNKQRERLYANACCQMLFPLEGDRCRFGYLYYSGKRTIETVFFVPVMADGTELEAELLYHGEDLSAEPANVQSREVENAVTVIGHKTERKVTSNE